MVEEVEVAAGAWTLTLADVRARLAPRFLRAEPRRRARAYVRALLEPVARKNGWQLAEAAGEATPHGMQRLLVGAGWDADLVRDDTGAYVAAQLGDPGGVLLVDETGFLKQGPKSAGVARQYSGTAGRRANQQVGVFLAYAAPRGCAFLDRALYLPEEWATDAARRTAAGIPAGIAFATKGELARGMLARAFAAGVPAAWVVGDVVYGREQLRRWLEGERRAYVLAVASDHGVWTAGAQVEVRALADALPHDAWHRWSAGAGSQGPPGTTGPASPCPTRRRLAGRTGCSSGVASATRASAPTTGSMPRRGRTRRRWSRPPGRAGASRPRSRRPRGWSGWTSTRCGAGRAGTAT